MGRREGRKERGEEGGRGGRREGRKEGGREEGRVGRREGRKEGGRKGAHFLATLHWPTDGLLSVFYI